MIRLKSILTFSFILSFFIVASISSKAQTYSVRNYPDEKRIVFGNKMVTLELDYNNKANLSSIAINGQEVIHGESGLYSSIGTKAARFSTLKLAKSPSISISNNIISLKNIQYGDNIVAIVESWHFTIT